MNGKGDENVLVVLRCRPFSEKEKAAGHKNIVEIQTNKGFVSLKNPKNESDAKSFTFDGCFDESVTQTEVYDNTARIIVDAVLEGFNGTVFAYGQTGTGKTFSMQGIANVPHLRGIIPNAFNHVFGHIARSHDKKFLVRVSFLEIYNEEIRDLLTKPNKNPQKHPERLELKEHPETGVYVKDLSTFVVKSVEELDNLMNLGNSSRSVGATLMNETSSRSHSIFTITIESSEPGPDGQDRFWAGKLHLVDLAGSERLSKTGATGDRLKEATKINLSLSALGNCISALVDGKSSHIPYRDSKLTRLLQDSLGGNAKTLMIATMSPANYNYEESLSTLRYANRAKNIKNKPKVNEDPKDAMLREYQEEIKKLKEQLEKKQGGGKSMTQGSPERVIIKKIVKKLVTKKVKKLVPRKKKESVVHDSRDDLSGDDDEQGDENDDEEEEEKEEEEEEEEQEVEEEVEVVEGSALSLADSLSNSLGSTQSVAEMDPETIAKLQEEVESEKRLLLASKDIVIEEKQRLAAELERRAIELENERKQREELALQLKAMEGKLLVGGVNIIDHVNAQEKALEERQIKIKERQRNERELMEKLELKQELQLQMEESYASLQEEVDVKSKKLKKLWTKLEAAKAEISDLHDEFRNEREDLLDTIRELTRELSLKMTVIDNFIPSDERAKIEMRAAYDEEHDDWELERVTDINLSNRMKRPVSQYTLKRPVCQHAKTMMIMGEPNPRYRHENIIALKLDIPERTTTQAPMVSKNSRNSALDFVMAGDEDQEIMVNSEAMDFDAHGYGDSGGGDIRKGSGKKSKTPKSSNKQKAR